MSVLHTLVVGIRVLSRFASLGVDVVRNAVIPDGLDTSVNVLPRPIRDPLALGGVLLGTVLATSIAEAAPRFTITSAVARLPAILPEVIGPERRVDGFDTGVVLLGAVLRDPVAFWLVRHVAKLAASIARATEVGAHTARVTAAREALLAPICHLSREGGGQNFVQAVDGGDAGVAVLGAPLRDAFALW